MPEISVVVPGVARSKRARSARRYEELVRSTARQQFSIPVETDIAIEIHYFYTTGHRVDVDNLQKTLFDGLKGAAYDDDSQIQNVTLRRYNISTSYTVEAVREDWIEHLESGRDFVGIVLRY